MMKEGVCMQWEGVESKGWRQEGGDKMVTDEMAQCCS